MIGTISYQKELSAGLEYPRMAKLENKVSHDFLDVVKLGEVRNTNLTETLRRVESDVLIKILPDFAAELADEVLEKEDERVDTLANHKLPNMVCSLFRILGNI